MVAVGYGDGFGLADEKKDFCPDRTYVGLPCGGVNQWMGELPHGAWSDDTQLSLAVAVSLIQRGSFQLNSMAKCHVDALTESERDYLTSSLVAPSHVSDGKTGWGKGTTSAVERLRRGVSPEKSGDQERIGNGVLMKMAPLMYWYLQMKTKDSVVDRELGMLTRMTHDNPESVAQTLRYADILRCLFHDRDLSKIPYGGYASETALLEATPRRGFTSWETLEVALYYFKQEPTFPDNIHLAIRYGGDSDSICSILGAMSVFNGTYSEPDDAHELRDYWRLRYVGLALDMAIDRVMD